jgi:hypothetical protein
VKPYTRLAPWLVALALGTLTFVYRFNTLGGTFVFDNDEYQMLTRVDLLLAGEQPLRDFADGELRGVWPALMYEVPAWIFRHSDAGLLPYAFMTLGMLAFCTAAVVLLGRAMSAGWLVPLLAGITLFLSQPNSYNYHKVLTLTLGAAAICWVMRRPSAARGARQEILSSQPRNLPEHQGQSVWLVPLAVLSAWTVVAGLFRHDNAIYIGLAAVGGLVARDAPNWRIVARRVGTYVGLTALLSLPSLIWVERYTGISSYIQLVMNSADTEMEARGLARWPTVDPAAPFGTDSLVAVIYYAFWLTPLVAAAVIAIVGWRRGSSLSSAERGLGVALVVMAVVVNHFFLRGNLLARIGDAAAPVMLGACWLAASAARLRSRGARIVAGAVPILLLAVSGTALAVAGEVPGQMRAAGLSESLSATRDVFKSMSARLRSLPPRQWLEKTKEGSLAISRYLAECTAPDDRVLMGIYADEIPYFARRRFAAGQGYFFHGFLRSEADQRLALERLARQSVPVAIMPYEYQREFADDYPLVAQHVAARFQEAGIVSEEGEPRFRVFVDNARRPASIDPVLGFPCFR